MQGGYTFAFGIVSKLGLQVTHPIPEFTSCLPNVSRRPVVADEKVLKVVRKSTILKLGPAASDVGRVLPHELSVVADPRTALVSGT